MSAPAVPAVEPAAPAGWTREALRGFVEREVAPHAGEWDRAERVPPEAIRRVAEAGYLGALVPREHGGAGVDTAAFAVLNEELGRGCSSLRSLLTVHSMAACAIRRWGSREQREHWLPRLAAGEAIGAFALSEPGVGSDASAVETEAVPDGDGYVLHGRKRWTTFGQVADLFLVVARSEGKPIALLVERGAPGLTVTPIRGVTGTRASLLAELHLDGCRVERRARLGGPGFGLGVALSALEMGRLSVAAGSVGIIQACLEASVRYARERIQFGRPIGEHQLVRRMVTNMAAEVRAARLLCERAARLYDAGDPAASSEIFIAKYYASTAATRAAADAVQIHGANGCTEAYPVERYLRDARVMEIIEGSTQIMQLTIARHEIEAYAASPPGPAATA